MYKQKFLKKFPLYIFPRYTHINGLLWQSVSIKCSKKGSKHGSCIPGDLHVHGPQELIPMGGVNGESGSPCQTHSSRD